MPKVTCKSCRATFPSTYDLEEHAYAGCPAVKLNPATLYLGDNGRAFCGQLRCAGTTAHYSGLDISGQPVEAITMEEAKAHGLRCETCGLDATGVRR